MQHWPQSVTVLSVSGSCLTLNVHLSWHEINLNARFRVSVLSKSPASSYWRPQSNSTLQSPQTMLLPRLSHSATVTGHLLRGCPSQNLLRSATVSTFLRSVSGSTKKPNCGPRDSKSPFFDVARSTRPSTILRLIWPQQSRGMKTRSSVKRLCDGCKVGILSEYMLACWKTC